jgi:ABC-type antimicrobial peptide transport system permease subunit
METARTVFSASGPEASRYRHDNRGISGILHSTLASPESSDFLYGVSYYDPLTFLGLSCFFAIVALLASLVPALHSLRVDPMIALRYE